MIRFINGLLWGAAFVVLTYYGASHDLKTALTTSAAFLIGVGYMCVDEFLYQRKAREGNQG